MPQQHNLLAPRYSTAPQQPPSSSNSDGKDYDVVGLSNLCLDVILPVDELPPPDPALRERLLDALTADPPSQESWEVGGNCNFLIAAARLGMKVGSVGHLGGADVYGAYMHAVLQVLFLCCCVVCVVMACVCVNDAACVNLDSPLDTKNKTKSAKTSRASSA